MKKLNKNKIILSDTYLIEVAKLFSVLGDPSRLKLLGYLMQSPLTVTELVNLAEMKQGNVSKHLSILYSAGFLGREQEGTFVRYSITDKVLEELCHLMCTRVEEELKTKLKKLS